MQKLATPPEPNLDRWPSEKTVPEEEKKILDMPLTKPTKNKTKKKKSAKKTAEEEEESEESSEDE